MATFWFQLIELSLLRTFVTQLVAVHVMTCSQPWFNRDSCKFTFIWHFVWSDAMPPQYLLLSHRFMCAGLQCSHPVHMPWTQTHTPSLTITSPLPVIILQGTVLYNSFDTCTPNTASIQLLLFNMGSNSSLNFFYLASALVVENIFLQLQACPSPVPSSSFWEPSSHSFSSISTLLH
jgi:hypothetical protein